jgi:hypothetical protein
MDRYFLYACYGNPAFHSRIDAGYTLVLLGYVTMHHDGTASVASRSTPGKLYHVGKACHCKDAQYKAPQGWCAHKQAFALVRRATQVAAERLANDGQPITPEHGVTAAAAEVIAPMQDAEASVQPLPEAPASVNVYLMINGAQCQLTLRDTCERRLLERLQAVLAAYPAASRQ